MSYKKIEVKPCGYGVLCHCEYDPLDGNVVIFDRTGYALGHFNISEVANENAGMEVVLEQRHLIDRLKHNIDDAIETANGWRNIVLEYDKHPFKHLWGCLLRKINP